MGLFDGSEFTSLASFETDDGVVDDKKANISAAAQEKQKVLEFKSQLFNATHLNDADTFAGQRFGGGPGTSFDAAETSDFRFEKDPLSAINQRSALANILGKEVSEVTNQDVIEYGKVTRDKAKDFLLEGFNQGAPVRANPDGSPFEGPSQPKIDIADTGEVTADGRPVVQVRNAFTGKDLISAFNNPEDNLNFNSRFNPEGKKAFKAKQEAKDKAQLAAQPSRVFSDKELKSSGLKYLANLGLLAADTVVGFGLDIGKSVTTRGLRNDITTDDLKAFQTLKQKEAIIRNTEKEIAATDDLDKKAKLTAALDDIKLTPEEAALSEPVLQERKGRNKTEESAEQTRASKYDAITKGYEEAGTRKIIQEFADNIKLGNSAPIQAAAETVGKRFDAISDQFTAAKQAFNDGDIEAATGAVTGILANSGLAFSDVIANNPEAIAPLIAESLPYMLAAGTKAGFAMITNTFYQDGIEAFQKENGGLLPTQQESMNILGTSLAASATELAGAKLVGLSKKLKPKTKPKVKAEAKPGIVKKVAKPVGKVIKGTAGEAITEAAQTALEELGAKQDVSKISAKDVFTGGVLGGIAGGGVSAGVEAGRQTVGLASTAVNKAVDTVDNVAKNKEKATRKQAENLAEVTDAESPNYRPEKAATALINETGNIAPENKEEHLAQVDNHLANLLDEVESSEGKKQEKLIKTFAKLNNDVANLRKSLEPAAIKEAAKFVETVNRVDDAREKNTVTDITPEGEQALVEGVRFGSEPIADTSKYDTIINSDNVSPEVKEVVRTARTADEAISTYAEATNQEVSTIKHTLRGVGAALATDQVSSEVVGEGTNKQGKKGALAHVAGIKNALATGSIDKARALTKDFTNFLQSRKNKLAALREAATLPEGQKVSYKTDTNSTATVEARGKGSVSLANTIEAEVNFMEALKAHVVADAKATIALKSRKKADTSKFDSNTEQGKEDSKTQTDDQILDEVLSIVNAAQEEGIRPDFTADQKRVLKAHRAKQDKKATQEKSTDTTKKTEIPKKLADITVTDAVKATIDNEAKIKELKDSLFNVSKEVRNKIQEQIRKLSFSIYNVVAEEVKAILNDGTFSENTKAIYDIEGNPVKRPHKKKDVAYILVSATPQFNYLYEVATDKIIGKTKFTPENVVKSFKLKSTNATLKKEGIKDESTQSRQEENAQQEEEETNTKVESLPKSINIASKIKNGFETLSNFAKRPFIIGDSEVEIGAAYKQATGKDITWDTVEGAFQASKLIYTEGDKYFDTDDKLNKEGIELVEQFAKATGVEAKALGRKIENLNTRLWNVAARNTMKALIQDSLDQNPKAEALLSSTKDAELIHDLGFKPDKWTKLFPQILTEIRENLNKEEDETLSTKLQKEASITEEITAAPAPTDDAGGQFPAVEMDIADLKDIPGNDLRKSKEEMEEFANKIESGEISPTVIVEMQDGKPVNLQEGNHTIAVLNALGKDKVTVRVINRKDAKPVSKNNEEDITSTKEAADVLLNDAIDPTKSKTLKGNQTNVKATEALKPINKLMRQARKIASSALGKTVNFVSSYITNKTKIIKDYNLTPEDQKGFSFFTSFLKGSNDINGFVSSFNSLFGEQRTFESQLKAFANDIELNPLLLLVNNEGKLPENVISGMGLGVLNWLSTRGKETIYNDAVSINMILGKSDLKEDPSTEAVALLTNIGSLRNLTAASIGKDIRKMLNIKAIEGKDVDGNFEAKLEMALGQMAISTAIKQGLVENNSIATAEYKSLTGKDDELDGKLDESSVNFLKIPITQKDDKNVPSNKNKYLIDNYKANKKFFSKVFNSTNYQVFPKDEPNKKVVDKVKGSINEPSSKLKKGIKNAQQVEHVAKENMFQVMENLSKELFLEMMGWVDPKSVHITKEESVNGKNSALEREYDNMIEFMEGRPKDKAFYFDYIVWSTMRMGDTSNTISLQNSKMHRHMFMPKAWEAEIDTSNASFVQFKLAVAEALGSSVDKKTDQTITDHFDRFIANTKEGIIDPKIEAGVNAILALRKTGKLTPAQRKAIADATAEGGEKIYSLDGIVALADYMEAGQTGKFTTNIPRETDGITNGVISAMIQMAHDVEDIKPFLNNGGMSFKDNPLPAMGAYFSDTTKNDNYENLTKLVARQLSDLRAFFVNPANTDNRTVEFFTDEGRKDIASVLNSLESLMGPLIKNELNSVGEAIENINRDFSKNPLMIFAYGAGLSKIKRKMAENSLDSLYEQINDAKNSPEDLAKISKHLTAILGKNINIKSDETVPGHARNFELSTSNAKYYKNLMDSYYGEALKSGLNESLGIFAANRAYVNGAIRVMNEVFLVKYQEAHNRAVEEKGVALSRSEINKLLEGFRDQGLLPGVKHASSEGLIDAIQLTATSKTIVSSEDGGKVQQTYEENLPSTRYSLENGKVVTKKEGKKGNEEGFKSNTSNIYTNEFDNSIGPAGFIRLNISNDANVQAALMAQFDMLNVHDAGMYNVLDTSGNTTVANQTYYELHNTFDMASNTQEALQPFLKELNKLTDEQKTAIDDSINNESELNVENKTKGITIPTGGVPITFNTVDEFVGEFNTKVEQITANKKEIMNQTNSVEQFADDGAQYSVEPEVIVTERSEVETGIDTAVDEMLDDNSSGSEPINFNAKSFNETYVGITKADTAANVFEDVSKMGDQNIDTPTHKTHLRMILDTIIIPALKSLSDLDTKVREQTNEDPNRSYGVYDDAESSIYIDAAPGIVNSNVEMSPAEIAVHEWLHAVGNAGIKNNFWAREELSRLFNLARGAKDANGDKIITWKSFLKRDGKGNVIVHDNMQAEEEAAQNMYDYIFNNQEGQHLEEFFVKALSNDSFSEALSQLDVKSTRDTKAGNIRDRIIQLFGKIVDWIAGRIQHTTGKTVDKAMYELAKNITNINEEQKSKVYGYMQGVSKFNSAAKRSLENLLLKPYMNLVEKNINKPRTTKAGKIVKGLLVVPGYAMMKTFNAALDDLMYGAGFIKDNVVFKFIHHELGATSAINLPWVKMLRDSKHSIDQMRKRTKDLTSMQVLHMFNPDNPPSDSELLQLTSGLLKTDISSLDPNVYDVPTLIKMFKDDKALNTKIAAVIRKLKKNYGTNANYYALQAKGLGIYMADGRIGNVNQMLNAHNIANLYSTAKKQEGNIAAAEALMDELATLYSISNLATEIRTITADRIESEFKFDTIENGISFVLNLHKNFKQESLDQLFKGNKVNMIKGYTKENYDPNINIRTGTLDQEAEYNKKGFYRKIKPLPRDRIFSTKKDIYLYVSKDGLVDRYASSISSLTDKENKGTDLMNAWQDTGSRTALTDSFTSKYNIRNRSKKFVDRQFNPDAELDFKTTHMVPIMSPVTKNIVGYRYVMEEATKVHTLNKRDYVHTTIGSMVASIQDKTQSEKVNRDIVELFKSEYDQFYQGAQREFVKVGIDSTDPRYKEIYQMMPKEMRRDVEEIWGEKNMFIRAEIADLVFGYRKFSMSQIYPDAHRFNRAVRMIEGVTQEVVSIAKRKIVLLMPEVLTANVISNTWLSLVKGVPLKYQVKYSATAITAINKIQRDIAKAEGLKNRLKIFKGQLTPTKEKAIKTQLAEAEAAIKNNPVRPLVDKGLFQSIVEDISDENEDFSYLGRVTGFLGENKLISNIPKGDVIRKTFEQITVSKNTENYVLALKATQYSDFVARFVMHKWQTEEQKMDVAKSIEDIVTTFVNYDLPQVKALQYINDMGILMFTKFLFRIQRVIWSIAKNNPVSTFALFAGQKAFGDVPDIFDTNLIGVEVIDRIELNPFGHVDDATDLSLLNYIPFFSMLGED